jgi:hypothetical protein
MEEQKWDKMNKPDSRVEDINNMKILASSDRFFYIGSRNADDEMEVSQKKDNKAGKGPKSLQA